ncbi:probable transcription factor At1g61730 [Salvia hispanica]|uniref:probable transcription factor At1g61730 n=1 Tax=Salvia hispanica TaxID=49212 RepID=UPI002009954D|nr:probable transcription factor At1g61730 [Salvia hispanica]
MGNEPIKPVEPQSESSEDDEEGFPDEVSDSESEAEQTQFRITTQKKSNPQISATSSPQRPAPSAAETEPWEKKSDLLQRLWSQEDEIVILKGMIDYTSKHESDPISYLNAFHDFTKKNASRSQQLQDKIERMKKEYENSTRTIAYDLSKKRQGNEDKGRAIVMRAKCSLATMEGRMMMYGEETFESGQRAEWEKEWNELRTEELRLHLKQMEIRVAQTKLVLGALDH